MTAQARIFSFMHEREAIVADVTARVVRDRVAAARSGADQSLEYVLNEAALLEMQRMEKGRPSALDLHSYGYWQGLARTVATLPVVEKERLLRDLTGAYARDVAGRFTPGVYRFATSVLPVGLGALLSAQRPSSLLNGARKLQERIVLTGAMGHWRRLAELGTLIVVPTHSSNLDSIAVGYALHEAGLPPMTYGAGKNLFSNPLTSFFMHNLGAYKVDRRIRHTLYKDVLKTYSEVLLEGGYHSLFFPGGTRSRSNHVETKLKLGLLGTGLSAYAANLKAGKTRPHVYVCPLTINYHLVLEAETLIDDHLRQDGGHRYLIEDDEFSNPAKVAQFLMKTVGMEDTVHIRFGEPLDLFGNPVDGEGDSRDPRGRPIDTARYLWRHGEVAPDAARDAEYTRQCGQAIAASFQRNTVAVSTAVVALAAWQQLSARYAGLDLYQRLRVAKGERLAHAGVCERVAVLQGELQRLAAAGQVQLAPEIMALTPAALVSAAAAVFATWHTAPVLALADGVVEVGHPNLLHYYANRLSGFGMPTGGRATEAA